jgi:hypothetical protein
MANGQSPLSGPACKPSSVPAFRRAAIIYLDQPLPTGSPANGKRPTRRPSGRSRSHPGQVRPKADRLLGLAGGGVYPAGDVAAAAVRSYRTISPLPVPAPPRSGTGHRPCVFCGTFPGAAGTRLADGRETGAGPRWPLATTVPRSRRFQRLLTLLGLSSGRSRDRRPPHRPGRGDWPFAIDY